jgi:hypothetical protein
MAASTSSRNPASGLAPTSPSFNSAASAMGAVRSGGAGAGPGGQLITHDRPCSKPKAAASRSQGPDSRSRAERTSVERAADGIAG